jgi:predicted membrane protein
MLAKYLLVWFLLAIVGITNGIIRQSTYGKSLSDLSAHQVSTVTAILASGTLVWFINRFWPIESSTQAWSIGIIWLVLTVAFEFGFGHYIARHSWEHLFADYNLMNGRVWSLFLIWIAIMPFVIFKLSSGAV